jgi:hypothetical protein
MNLVFLADRSPVLPNVCLKMAVFGLTVLATLTMAVAAAPAFVVRQSNSAGAAVPECYTSCAFTFCPYTASITPGTPDRPLTGAICSKDPSVIVGHVDETGEALVATPGGPLAISSYNPTGLRQRFPPSFWKAYGLPVPPGGTDLSGVGHETPQQNQANYITGQCFILPLREYQILNRPGGYVVANVRPTQPLSQCVAFSVGPAAAAPATPAGAGANPGAPSPAPLAPKAVAAMEAAPQFFGSPASPTVAPTKASVAGQSAAPTVGAGGSGPMTTVATMPADHPAAATTVVTAVSPENASPTIVAPSVYAPAPASTAPASAYPMPATQYATPATSYVATTQHHAAGGHSHD